MMSQIGAIRLAVCLLLTGLAAGPGWAARPKPQADKKPNPYDPQAIRLLNEMADAYTHLTGLRQETEFTSAVMPLTPLPEPRPEPAGIGPAEEEAPKKPDAARQLNTEHKLDRKLRLSFRAPNRLRLEVEDTDDNGKVQLSSWVCDGKTFWTYNPAKNLFSKEKAPKKIHDFAKLAHMTSGSLEILMLMGINPFDRVEEQSEAVRYAGNESVQGVATEVVTMSADLGPQTTETRLYIGAEDHLLYRLVSETTQKPRPPKRTGVGSPLDELATPEPASAPPVSPEGAPALPGVLMKTRVICDNKIDSDAHFDPADFAYQPPPGAYYLTNPDPKKPPLTLKQRIAELNRAAKQQKKAPPKIYRY